MTVSEKIYTLRTQLGLSQEELAEKLGVSRQSVSKWETGQSVPDLEKIIKLSDLFGVSVDELVRAEERPQPPQPETKVVYVKEKWKLTRTQTTGFCLEMIGLALDLLGLVGEGGLLVLVGTVLVVLGLPLLLAKKHPWIAFGWTCVALSLLVLNPNTSITPWGIWGGIQRIVVYLKNGERYISYLIVGVAAVARGLLTLALIVLTWRAWRKGRQEKEPR